MFQHTAQLINLLIKHGKPYQLQVLHTIIQHGWRVLKKPNNVHPKSVCIVTEKSNQDYDSGLPWRTSQSPTSGFERTLLDLPPLLPQEEPVRSEHCHHQEKNHPHFCKKPLDRERNFSLARSEFAENAKELELIAEQVQSVKYLLTFQLLTI